MENFVKKVNEKLVEGWELHGHTFMLETPNNIVYMQPVKHREKSEVITDDYTDTGIHKIDPTTLWPTEDILKMRKYGDWKEETKDVSDQKAVGVGVLMKEDTDNGC